MARARDGQATTRPDIEVEGEVDQENQESTTRREIAEMRRDLDAFRAATVDAIEEAARPILPRELLRMLRDAADQGLQAASVEEARWHLIVVPDTGKPRCEAFVTPAELAAYMRPLVGQDLHLVPFYGRKCGVTKRGHHLLTHEGRFGLIDAEDADEVDPSGYVGRPGVELSASGRDARHRESEDGADDEEFEDDADEIDDDRDDE